MKVDSIPALRAFVAAADTQSFKQAGTMLGLSSSAIGKAIARLEHQLSAALFHRTTRTISLTDEGALYLERARRVLAELEDAEADLAHATGGPRGRLRVSLPLSGSVFTPVMGGFMLRHPEVELELDYSDRLVDVIGEGFDAVIRTGPPADTRLKARKLTDLPWLLAASPSYVAARGAPSNSADLVRHVCLRQRLSSGKVAPWPLRGDEGTAEIPASLTASIIDPLIELAIAGIGIVCAPNLVLREHLVSGELLPLMTVERSGVLNVLWPSSRYRIPKVRAFVDYMVEWAARQHPGS